MLPSYLESRGNAAVTPCKCSNFSCRNPRNVSTAVIPAAAMCHRPCWAECAHSFTMPGDCTDHSTYQEMLCTACVARLMLANACQQTSVSCSDLAQLANLIASRARVRLQLVMAKPSKHSSQLYHTPAESLPCTRQWDTPHLPHGLICFSQLEHSHRFVGSRERKFRRKGCCLAIEVCSITPSAQPSTGVAQVVPACWILRLYC